jgi:hypothetical protein
MTRIVKVVALLAVVAAVVGVRVFADQPRVSPVQATETVCTITDPGVSWITGNGAGGAGVLHIRGQVRHDRVVPDPSVGDPRVDGYADLTANLDVDLASFDGTLAGSVVITPSDPAYDGAFFAGHFTAKLAGGLAYDGRADAQGVGQFDGLKLSGTFENFVSSANGGCIDESARPFPTLQTHVTGQIFDPSKKN